MHLLMIFINTEIDCFKDKNSCFNMYFIIKKNSLTLSSILKQFESLKVNCALISIFCVCLTKV